MDILKVSPDFTSAALRTTFVLGFTTLLLLVWYTHRKLTYWKRLGIPYAKGIPVFGSIYEAIKKPIHVLELERYLRLGRVYGHYEGNSPLLSVAEPELLRSILIKDFHVFSGRRDFDFGDKVLNKILSAVNGEDWKRIRTIVTPTFTTGKIKRMLSIFKECSQATAENFRKLSEEGKYVDAKILYGAFTMDVIASSAFSTKIDSHNDPNNPFVANARLAFSSNLSWRFIFLLLMPRVMKFFKIPILSVPAVSFFTNVTIQIMEERRKTGQKGNDFLQLLMDSSDELLKEGKVEISEKDDISETYGKVDSDVFKPNTLTKKTLSQDELIAQCLIFFLAGYDTTASALSFVSYLLALNPDCQEKLIQEVDEALRQNNGELSYEAIQSMKYLDNVIAETLRVYSPAIRLERAADEDYKLGDTGITIPKGMILSIPVYALHHDPTIYPDPEKFDPDRFTPEERSKRHQYAYMPFGAGPRNCVAMRFALMEVKVCIAHVVSNFRIKTCPETKVPLEWTNGGNLLQPQGIILKMEVREDAVTDTS